MKKFLLFTIVAIQSLFAVAQQNDDYKILLEGFKEAYNAPKPAKWLKDADGNMYCALIRVVVDGLSRAEAEKVYFGFAQNTPAHPRQVEMNGEQCVLNIFVTPTDEGTYIDAALDGYGKSNRVNIPTLKEKHIYTVTLRNNKKLSISFKTIPSNAVARLETGEKIFTPGTMNNIVTGRHYVTFTLNGKTVLTDTINVSDEKVHFDYDLRPKKSVTFTSTPSNIELYIDDKFAGRTPLTKTLSYSTYKVEARKTKEEIDVRTINVSDFSDPNVKLSPSQKKTFSVYATHRGMPVKASLFVDYEQYGNEAANSYRLTYPLKQKVEMEMIYNGKKRSRTVKVKKNMDSNIEFKIPVGTQFQWPWQREYDARPIGVSVGYVNKQWVASDASYKGVLPWQASGYDAEGASLHGLQAGFHLQPCFSWGGGIYSGLFLELFYGSSSLSRLPGYEVEPDMFDNYTEFNLYVPLHLYYRMPFSKDISLSLHGGVGMDCGLYNRLICSDNDNKEPNENFYGDPGMPSRFSFSAEVGVGFRLWDVQINAQYSKGLSKGGELKLGEQTFKTVQNKLTIGVSYLIPGTY